MSVFGDKYPLNQAALLVEWLIDQHGFELRRAGDTASTRVIDDQHAISAYLVGGKAPSDWTNGPVAVRVGFGLARRDINETTHEWKRAADERWAWTRSTALETDEEPFLPGGRLRFDSSAAIATIQEKTEAVLGEVTSLATLEGIDELIFRPGNSSRNGFDRIVTDALSGRDDRSAPDLARIRALAIKHGPESKFGSIFSHFESHLEDFRTKFPDGIER